MKKTVWLCLLVTAVVAAGCAPITRFGLRRAGPVFGQISRKLETETDLDLLREAMPSSVLTLESLLAVDPANRELLLAACKGWIGYAQAFLEDESPERASRVYRRARDLGLAALRTHRAFRKAMDGGEKWSVLVKRFGKGDVPALFWTATAWAGWLNLNMDDMEALLDTTTIVLLMEKVLELQDDYYYNGAHVFFGVYYINIPKMAGGGPEKARAEFDKAMAAAGGKFLIAKVMFARYYAGAFKDRELFRKVLNEVIEAPPDALPEAGAANAVARRKAKALLAREEELF